jgi:hypothetical protein
VGIPTYEGDAAVKLFTLVAAVLYVFALLFAQGWLLAESLSRAIACVAGGLLASVLAGVTPPTTRRLP